MDKEKESQDSRENVLKQLKLLLIIVNEVSQQFRVQFLGMVEMPA